MMTFRRAILPILFLTSLGAVGISCDSSSNSTATVTPPPPPAPQPGASPSPSPSPTLTPIPRISWGQVREVKTCPFPDCPAADGFTVTNGGRFFSDNQSSGSRVTPTEFAQLNTIANLVASNTSLIGFDCVSIDPLPGMSSVDVNLTLTDGTTQLIYQISTDQQTKCFRGSLQTAEALFQSIDTLAGKYYVTPGSG